MDREKIAKHHGLIISFSKPDLLIHSIHSVKPRFVAIIVIQQMMTEAATAIKSLMDDYEFEVYYAIHNDMENPTEAFYKFNECLDWITRELEREDIIVDISSGLVPTRFGVIMGAISHNQPVFYLSQKYLGMADNALSFDLDLDNARFIMLTNPLEKIGIIEAMNGVTLFNMRNYAGASFVFQQLQQKVDSPELQSLYQGMQFLAEGYKAWDVLQYSLATQQLGRARKYLTNKLFNLHLKNQMTALVSMIDRNLSFLASIDTIKIKFPLIIDCYFNAKRRIDDEKRYDDGVARLYRVIEMVCQYRLKFISINHAQDIDWHKINPDIRARFCERRQMDAICLPLRLSLYDSLILLDCYDDEIAREIVSKYNDDLLQLLGARNLSVLAHGMKPVKDKVARDFVRLVQAILALSFQEEMSNADFMLSASQGKLSRNIFDKVFFK